MADIALLVAEEFEKRLKRGAPSGAEAKEESKGTGMGNFGAVTKLWESAASGAKVRVALLVKADVPEPKSRLAMAAFDGIFSA
ncbi:uncharacterized protein LOC100846035 [Brachypodium distachyon]|uniref:Uncharacterized protein n=1 Tax=Brachypodium distachyon TaxID=15368 RepID=I1H967_BRADI|nr:uncharacterized protein LOC100846035 [Brachypodium distachyon]KQK23394.1 hypothetical protein BRADI_1g73100v3 [Brachypodium distachyon]|eukprot:XP_003558703.1 uncharacterized protein LOC100846035 [Brachypodium distachyon]